MDILAIGLEPNLKQKLNKKLLFNKIDLIFMISYYIIILANSILF
jgi:hypothetical protein